MSARIAASVCLLLIASGLAATAAEPADELVIHEWGTFTVLQDAQGDTLSGVNVNEEPLPPFTHNLFPGVVRDSFRYSPSIGMRAKGLPPRFTSATMRMETPVIYLYPPAGQQETIDVSVTFNGGWISEWFPQATVEAPGFDKNRDDLGVLNSETKGSVSWEGIAFDSEAKIPQTNQHVWLAPREVKTPVLTANGQAEKYLFYRGVANIVAPLRVIQDEKTGDCRIVRSDSEASKRPELAIRKIWLVDIAKNGQVAYQTIAVPAGNSADGLIASTPFVFAADRYRDDNMNALKVEMKQALIAEGLFEDEAAAMLKTWELSYFKSAGTRLFFTLPREWTDDVLPLKVSQPARIERVMIGRIEIINANQRKLLAIINQGASNPDWFWSQLKSQEHLLQIDAELAEVATGERKPSDVSLKLPADYTAYLQLGRFRESLVANAARQSGNDQIKAFAINYRLQLR